MASRQAPFVHQKTTAHSRNEQISLFFGLSLSVFPLSSSIQQQLQQQQHHCRRRRSHHQHKIFECLKDQHMNACGLHCAQTQTDNNNNNDQANPIDNFLYAYLMLVAYRFMFCLH